jgi:hypothetical protein
VTVCGTRGRWYRLQVKENDSHPTERYTVMARDPIIMKSKQTICEVMGLVMDIEMEMRLSRFVSAFQRGDFKSLEGIVPGSIPAPAARCERTCSAPSAWLPAVVVVAV